MTGLIRKSSRIDGVDRGVVEFKLCPNQHDQMTRTHEGFG